MSDRNVGGANVEGDVEAGGDFIGRDRRSSGQRQNVIVRGSQESQHLWAAISDMNQRLDDLPNRVNKLEEKATLASRPLSWIVVVFLTLFVTMTVSSVAATAYTVQQLLALNELHEAQERHMEELETEIRDLNGRFGALVYMVMPPKSDVLRGDSEPWPMPTPPTQP